MREPEYRRFIKRLPCVACLKTWNVDPAHTGAHGMGQKSSDLSCIPLCRTCHEAFDADPRGFAQAQALDVPALLAQFNEFYTHWKGANTVRNSRSISPDEGYRPGEAIVKPFFAHALPCESCGAPVSTRKPAEWDSSLQVGPCCEFSLNQVPNIPTCDGLWPALAHCTSVADVEAVINAHCCKFCGTTRKAA